MIGSWKWNTGLGALAFILSFFFSLEHNTYFVSVMRSCYSFIFFFLLGYLPRFLFARFGSPQEPEIEEPMIEEKRVEEENPADEFQPMNATDINKASQVIRQWTNES
ncbi:hypothetical protein [Ammoniphilus resinae]|uniref:Uncharacterized protein n=1 Tax=Ammoniphilus resinae TaxID=861532 RepID=A0ABS4GL30_9BACL|nr:hypothetical protein [Ammoniphilus resinae]MBP1930802.1 hypothetical protein [Ammoniphilus resinae]